MKAHIEVYRGNSGELNTLVSETIVDVSGHEEAQGIVDRTHVKEGYMIGYWLEEDFLSVDSKTCLVYGMSEDFDIDMDFLLSLNYPLETIDDTWPSDEVPALSIGGYRVYIDSLCTMGEDKFLVIDDERYAVLLTNNWDVVLKYVID